MKTPIISADDLCPGTLITDVLVTSEHEYFLAGTYNGTICLYKVSQPTRLLHVYEGHIKSILALNHHTHSDFFISASSDNTVRVWNYNSFSQIYVFKLPNIAHPVNFVKFLQSGYLAFL